MKYPIEKKTPWHVWVVGALGLLWNSMGVLDYVMTHMKNETYMGAFSEEQIAYFYGFPLWMEICWAVALFGGTIGLLMLLFRRKLAVPVFAISFLAVIGTIFYSYGVENEFEVMGIFATVMTVCIFSISLFLVIYSIRLKNQGVLN